MKPAIKPRIHSMKFICLFLALTLNFSSAEAKSVDTVHEDLNFLKSCDFGTQTSDIQKTIAAILIGKNPQNECESAVLNAVGKGYTDYQLYTLDYSLTQASFCERIVDFRQNLPATIIIMFEKQARDIDLLRRDIVEINRNNLSLLCTQ
jgi:hypothetical protein